MCPPPLGFMDNRIRGETAVETSGYTTAGGIGVEVAASDVPETVLEEVVTTLGERRGGVLSSGMEYPGPLQPLAPGLRRPLPGDRRQGPQDLRPRAERARQGGAAGRRVLPARRGQAHRASRRRSTSRSTSPESEEILPEEMRSRRPTVFTALREIIAAFRGDDAHLGLYGAFGYDLAFQFEPIRQVAHPRPPTSVTWCCTCPTRSS